ncbi:kinase-like domain-containing protein [Rhizophagus clarus]|uniref:Kinase-like domain-containing protein n=1 Tax=Rhizophagus clarus TaxID=94130 RepID=A0A8H3R406_9GLOM|nr:kinase-like domain-containing protein [Rhizophagus clarus]
MAKVINIIHLKLELDWTSPLDSKSNSPILGIGQCPIPTLKNGSTLAHIKLPNISPEIFQMVLRYIYGGRLSLEEYDALDIIKILVASSEFNLQELITHLQLFLEPEKVFNSIDFTSLSENCLVSLIQHENFQMNEIQVWEQVLKWGIAQSPELPSDPFSYSKDDFNVLRNILQQCIPFIKFFRLSHKEFLDKVYPYKKILPKDLRENLIRHFINQPNNPEITKEIDSMAISCIQKNLSIEKDFYIMADKINDFICKSSNNGIEFLLVKQQVIEYFDDHNINSQETYNWLLNNQVDANSIFLLGYLNLYGIMTRKNDKKAFNLFINASEKNHALAQYFVGKCYDYGYGTIKNEKLAFEYYEKAANKNYALAQLEIGYNYNNGIGIKEDFEKALYWYGKAANGGNIIAKHDLGVLYRDGIGIEKNYNKAFELFKQSAEGGYSSGIMKLGYCYSKGIGTKVDKKKAFELYQNAANLGDEEAQYNLALMYEKGYGIIKDIGKAIYWYEKCARQGDEDAQNKLKILQINNY